MGNFVVITATVFKSISSGPWFQMDQAQIFRGRFGQKPNVELFIVNLHAQRTNLANLSNQSWPWVVRQRSHSYLIS